MQHCDSALYPQVPAAADAGCKRGHIKREASREMMEKNVISVSGGKDSTALLLLAIERKTENMQAVFADTGNEHPQTYEYVRYLEKQVGIHILWIKADFSRQIAGKAEFINTKWREQGIPDEVCDRAIAILKPTGNPFLDLCLWKGRFPSTKARFCSEEMKKNPITEQVHKPLLMQGYDVVSWQGVRADESASRAGLPERECKMVTEGGAELWNYRPILKWTAKDCFAMHEKHGIKHNPLYEQGMGRVGCMPCIHCRKDELLEITKRFPDEIARIAEWEAIVSQAAKRQRSTFFSTADGRGDGIHEVVEWSKTGHGGKQYDMLRADNDDSGTFMCSSIYGLCE